MEKSSPTFSNTLEKIIHKLKTRAIHDFPEPQRLSAYEAWWLIGNLQILMDKLKWVCDEAKSYEICPPVEYHDPSCMGPVSSMVCDECWENWKNADLRK